MNMTQTTTKDTLYDKDEFKLIDRVCQTREIYPDLKVGKIQRPNETLGFSGNVFQVDIEY